MSRTAVIALILTAIVGVTALFLFARRADDREPATPVRANSPSVDVAPSAQPAANQPAERVAEMAEVSADAIVDSNGEPHAISGLDARSLTMCNRELMRKKGLEQFSCDDIDENNTLALDHCRSQIAGFNRRLQEATARAAPCPESLAHPSEYYEAIKVFAERGDVYAQHCFIQGYFGISKEIGMNLTQAEHDEYVPLARKFIDARLERGDWSVVRWLSQARVDMLDLMLARAYPIGIDNPQTVYKMSLLLVLGHQPGLSNFQNDDPKRLVEFFRQQKRLTPEQFEEAERWAQTMYDQHFRGSQEGASILSADFCSG